MIGLCQGDCIKRELLQINVADWLKAGEYIEFLSQGWL